MNRDPEAVAEIRAIFEATAAEAILERPRILRAKTGKARLLRTDSGEIVTHGQLLQGLLARVDLDVAVQDGKRPKYVACSACKIPVRVPPGGGIIPSKCKACKGAFCSDCGKPSAQGKPVKFCAECVAKRSAARLLCSLCGKPKRSRVSKQCKSCYAASMAKPKVCVDCGKKISGTRGSNRCRSCGCKWREANRSPEERARRAEAARKQLTPERRRELARLGGRASAQKRKTTNDRAA